MGPSCRTSQGVQLGAMEPHSCFGVSIAEGHVCGVKAMHYKPVLYVSLLLGAFHHFVQNVIRDAARCGGRGSIQGHCVNGFELAAISEYQLSGSITNSCAR